MDECEGDKSEIDKLLLSLSPLISPQKERSVTSDGVKNPRQGKVQVPGRNIKAISISQLPEDFKNRMKEVMTCKTSTGGTTCLIHLGTSSLSSKSTKSTTVTEYSDSDNTPSTAEDQKGTPSQETPVLNVDKLSPPAPLTEIKGLAHQDLLEDQPQRSLDITRNDTVNSNVSLPDNYEPFDL